MDIDSLPQARLLGGVWKKNSEDTWYFNRLGPVRRALRWLAWFGGWFKHDGRTFRNGNGKWRSPTPVSLFGHRVTFFRGWWTFRCKPRQVCHRVSSRKPTRQVYWSTDGTAGKAYRVTRGDPIMSGVFGKSSIDHIDGDCIILKPTITIRAVGL